MKSRVSRLFSARGLRALHLGLSPWMVVGMAIILGLAITALAVRSNQRVQRPTITLDLREYG